MCASSVRKSDASELETLPALKPGPVFREPFGAQTAEIARALGLVFNEGESGGGGLPIKRAVNRLIIRCDSDAKPPCSPINHAARPALLTRCGLRIMHSGIIRGVLLLSFIAVSSISDQLFVSKTCAKAALRNYRKMIQELKCAHAHR